MVNIRKLESELWEAADLLRADSKVTSQEYCMPVLGLIFLRYAYSRFKFVEADILKDRPVRNGRVLPVEADDFKTKSAIYLPEEARYEYLLNLPDNAQVGEAINHAMELIEEQSAQLKGILPKSYTSLKDDLLRELLRIFNNSAFNEIKDDIIGRIYEYFLNKFAPVVASDDGVFFTPKSLVRMIVNIIEPNHGTVLDPACGSGGMFVSSADFIESFGTNANTAMTFYGQEKLEYNAKLCIMNMAVHGLNAKIVSGDEANSFYKDAHNLDGCCDFVMANPPFNVDKVKSETTQNAGRLPFGLPGVNKNKEISNANYLWISYFYAYLNETGRAGFVMAASATDSQGKDKDIRQALIETGDVDVMISVGSNFFYTKSLPCSLWFFDKAKKEENKGKVLFIDARNYYTVVDRTLNEWSEWQMKNLNSIVWLYRGETEKYTALLKEYHSTVDSMVASLPVAAEDLAAMLEEGAATHLRGNIPEVDPSSDFTNYKEKLEWEIEVAKRAVQQTFDMTKVRSKRVLESKRDEYINTISCILTVINEYSWLTGKFGNGLYKDILGLCKIVDKDTIEQNSWSLSPGVYVGVEKTTGNDYDFHEEMSKLHHELIELQKESDRLMSVISTNMLGLDL